MKNQPFTRRLVWALTGIKSTFARERSFRLQTFAGVLVAIVIGTARPAPIWCAVFMLVTAGVLSLELLNSALETALDRLHPERHESIRLAKDAAAGAVLVMSLAAVLIFAAFLYERWMAR